jgi:hypothetical protein
MTDTEAWRRDPRERLLTAIDSVWARCTLDMTPEQLADTYTAAAYRQAADEISSDDTCGCGGCDSCAVNAAANHLRDRADEIENGTHQ